MHARVGGNEGGVERALAEDGAKMVGQAQGDQEELAIVLQQLDIERDTWLRRRAENEWDEQEAPEITSRSLAETLLGGLARKRDGALKRITLDDDLVAAPDQAEAVLVLSDVIERLAAEEPRLARVVDCRFFGGMTDEEIADGLQITVRTVQRDWVKARMLLRHALAP